MRPSIRSMAPLAAIVILCANSFVPTFAQGHLQTWNLGSRERSRRLCSNALNLLTKGELQPAADLLLKATQEDPSDPLPLETLGMTYLRQGKSQQALDALEKAYALLKDPETLLSTGFAYYLAHDYDAAIESWTKALERGSGKNSFIEAEGNIGFAYLRKGDFVKADEHFRKLIKARPDAQIAYQGLAILNYLAGNFTAARRAAEHAQSIQSYYPLLLLLAKLDFLQGDPKSGQKRISEWNSAANNKRTLQRSMTAIGYPSQHDFHWDPFLTDNFDNGRTLKARTSAQMKLDEKKKTSPKKVKAPDALSLAQAAADTNPNDYFILRELGLIELASGDYEQAAFHFRRVLQLCPACSVDWLHLARALSFQGKSGEASYAIGEFQRTHPNQKLFSPFAEIGKAESTPGDNPLPKNTNAPKPKNEGEPGF